MSLKSFAKDFIISAILTILVFGAMLAFSNDVKSAFGQELKPIAYVTNSTLVKLNEYQWYEVGTICIGDYLYSFMYSPVGISHQQIVDIDGNMVICGEDLMKKSCVECNKGKK